MIFTFYSYKGGVGRSMALAAVANVLALRGLRVLVVDFDLEAPGLERYFFDGERSQSVRTQPGLMDLVQAYRRALTSEEEFSKAEFKALNKFVLPAIHVAGTLGGSVDLMTAGERWPEDKLRDYALTVRGFNWLDFFRNWKGDLFFDWLRRQFTDPKTGYDVVLVDSRTGVTEMGGVCAYQLADVAVLLSAANYQNLEGTRDVVRDFRSEGVLSLRQGRELEILVVPARVEESHPRKDEFLDAFERELGVSGMPKRLAEAGLSYRKLALPYLPQLAVEEWQVGGAATAAQQPVLDVFGRLADALTLLAEPSTPLGALQSDALDRLGGVAVKEAQELIADSSRSSAGYDVFLDYGVEDRESAGKLRSGLEEAGVRVFDDTIEIGAGESAPQAIETALEYSRTLLVCFGRSMQTPWRERILARARRMETVRVLPLLLPGGELSALRSYGLDANQVIDASAESPSDDESVRILDLLMEIAQATKPRQASRTLEAAPARDPYPGAHPYTEDDADYFFGREAEIDALRAALANHDVVVLSGPAQIGKTSLLRAGLMRRLRPGGAQWSTEFRLGELAWLDYGADGSPEWPTWLQELPAGDRRWEVSTRPPHLVMIDGIDTFAHDGGEDAIRARVAEVAEAVARAGAACKVVLCWRDVLPEDQQRAILDGAPLASLAHVDLVPLGGDPLRRAIEEPARRAGHLLEPGLAERLIESAKPAIDAIAQIQRTLAAIWPGRQRGWVTNKALDAAGHLGGVFEQHLAVRLAALPPAEKQAAEVLFRNLVILDSNLRLVAVQRPWADLATVERLASVDTISLRDRLASEGLIDLQQPRVPKRDGEAVAAGAMVSLVRQDPKVYVGGDGALPDPRFFLWRSQLASLVGHWESSERSPEALLRGLSLGEAEAWLRTHRAELTEPERDLIDRSVVERKRIATEEEVQRVFVQEALTSMSNLAVTLWNQGDPSGARTLEDQVLGVRRRLLGDEHPDTLASMNNLAAILRGEAN